MSSGAFTLGNYPEAPTIRLLACIRTPPLSSTILDYLFSSVYRTQITMDAAVSRVASYLKTSAKSKYITC
jgi:hypothetical protein